ncbi:PEP/pyruvate-binding domain-containing protein [Opitutus terrae]|uniref:Pyruvate phosphate dikinase PEP/pyruvate-binding n=1 Tax=Opitutus terrae (strain DSM 11246 / JCM 15787 / PB90-1) TaxID=452637 RepID=B1ZVL0_OPITP|nr:PEP/pyruvate-binding domain-containing protein [Opitutus terrae]ACB74107.1 pyruvate phosphate dikinase PEP/pyruvate-binding [Opitutus terrae PB90-1]
MSAPTAPLPATVTTGLLGLDRVLHGIEPGDNIVWEVDSIEEYHELVRPYAAAAKAAGRHLIYFRFATHEPMLTEDSGAEIHQFDCTKGFETFVRQIHGVIEQAGRGAIYVFDCLSHIADTWMSDQTLGNFFSLTCPRLWDLETVTYFALYRDHHSGYAIDVIRETTQFMLDVFRLDLRLYIRPLKVQHRSQEVMNTIHVQHGSEFLPVRDSAVLAQILSRTQWPRLQSDRKVGHWRRLFQEAEQVAQAIAQGSCTQERHDEIMRRIRYALRVHRSGIAPLVERFLTLPDFLAIRDRMIGIGSVGGKTLGMLVARAILRARDPDLASRLEVHDSFFVGAEVFISYLVQNGVWWLREQQKKSDTFLRGLDEGRRLILGGRFPAPIMEQFQGMLDYFGESPYIVRSSSILEDARGNAFSGKYESVFVANRGSREDRMAALLEAVRRVYASVLDEEALRYRLRRGLLESEERMALLIMRVSGAPHGRYYYPQAAGVALSYNPFVWHPDIDPHAGMLRLVFGLGTRAVDRCDDDYTRLVALNAPERRPETNFEEVRDHSQRRMDCLDLRSGTFVSLPLGDVLAERPEFQVDYYLTNTEPEGYPCITFDRLIKETQVAADLRRMLALLEEAYEHPVDTEFTLNFLNDGTYRIHLLQCRTFQVRRENVNMVLTTHATQNRLLAAHGAVIGVSREQRLSRIIYVVQDTYAQLGERERYAVARLIGRLNQQHPEDDRGLMLIGPGRWGTHSPSLGIPVVFAEISRASVICEVVAMHERLIPDVSLGTHFFNDLVEHDMLYLAYFPKKTNNSLDVDWFRNAPSRLLELEPSASQMADIVRVIDCDSMGGHVWLRADATAQEAIVFRTDASLSTAQDPARTPGPQDVAW